jgi:predicted ATPase
LTDRLRLLTGGPRIDDRHRSLRSTLDWSYALLDEPDQPVLRRVSGFAGPFTAGAAAAVLADWRPVPLIDRAVDEGIRRFTALIAADNEVVIRLMRKHQRRFSPGGRRGRHVGV